MSELRSAGRPVVVVLSEQLVRQPEATLRAACLALGLPFEPAMLSWQAGPKPYDGVWAPWWYGNTHGATGETACSCLAPGSPFHPRSSSPHSGFSEHVREACPPPLPLRSGMHLLPPPSPRSGFSDRVQDVRQPLPDRLKPLLGECQALFRLLKRMAVKPCSGYSGEPSGWFCLVHQGRHCSAYCRRGW